MGQAPVALLSLGNIKSNVHAHAALRLGKRAYKADSGVAVVVDGPGKHGQSEDAGHAIHM